MCGSTGSSEQKEPAERCSEWKVVVSPQIEYGSGAVITSASNLTVGDGRLISHKQPTAEDAKEDEGIEQPQRKTPRTRRVSSKSKEMRKGRTMPLEARSRSNSPKGEAYKHRSRAPSGRHQPRVPRSCAGRSIS